MVILGHNIPLIGGYFASVFKAFLFYLLLFKKKKKEKNVLHFRLLSQNWIKLSVDFTFNFMLLLTSNSHYETFSICIRQQRKIYLILHTTAFTCTPKPTLLIDIKTIFWYHTNNWSAIRLQTGKQSLCWH